MWNVYDLEGRTIAEIHAAEDILLRKAKEEGAFSLMFSRLSRPGISISNKQNLEKDVDVALASQENIGIARRKTGGRTVYLDENFLIISVAKPNKKVDIVEAYQTICSAINTTLAELIGHDVRIENRNDLLVGDGRKIGGAAQRNDGAVLIHCYVRYGDSLDTMLPYLKIDGRSLAPYQEVIAGLISHVTLYKKVSYEAAYQQVRGGLIRRLCGGTFALKTLSAEERVDLERRAQEYLRAEWVQGTGDEPSRGHCDIIADTTLLIPDLVGKVTYK